MVLEKDLRGETMADIKIVFFDIDGTLIDPKTRQIPDSARQAVHQLQRNGILVSIATGRPPYNLPDFGDLHFDIFCTYNGSLCYNEKEIIFNCPIAPEDVQKVRDNVTALGRPLAIGTRDRIAASGYEQDLADYYTHAGLVLTVAEDFEEVYRDDIYQMMMGYREEELPVMIQGVKNVKFALSCHCGADLVAAGGGKGNGIRKILEYYHLAPSQAMAFGDNHNDMEMLEAVGTGVAMGNATAQLKEIADEICGDVSENGVYHHCAAKGLI